MAKLTDREAEGWSSVFWVCRSLGVSPYVLHKKPKCVDGLCGVDRDRWEKASGTSGPFYRCSSCARFIGYIR